MARTGKKANLGVRWENEIAEYHRVYRLQGHFVEVQARRVKPLAPTQLLTWKLGRPPGAVRSMSGHAFPAIWEATSPPDYLALVAGLPPLLMDAKSAKGERWPLDAVAPHQAEAFDRWERNRGRSFVLLRLDDPATDFPIGRWLLPWSGPLAELWHAAADGTAKRGNKSLSPTDCALMGFALSSGDWLPAAWSLWGTTLPLQSPKPTTPAQPKLPLYARQP